MLKENFDFIGFIVDFCLTFFTVEFGYDKADQPNASAYASAEIVTGPPLS